MRSFLYTCVLMLMAATISDGQENLGEFIARLQQPEFQLAQDNQGTAVVMTLSRDTIPSNLGQLTYDVEFGKVGQGNTTAIPQPTAPMRELIIRADDPTDKTHKNSWPGWYRSGYVDNVKMSGYDSVVITKLQFDVVDSNANVLATAVAKINPPGTMLDIVTRAGLTASSRNDDRGAWPTQHASYPWETQTSPFTSSSLRLGVGDGGNSGLDWALFYFENGNGNGDFDGSGAFDLGGENELLNGGQRILVYAVPATTPAPTGAPTSGSQCGSAPSGLRFRAGKDANSPCDAGNGCVECFEGGRVFQPCTDQLVQWGGPTPSAGNREELTLAVNTSLIDACGLTGVIGAEGSNFSAVASVTLKHTHAGNSLVISSWDWPIYFVLDKRVNGSVGFAGLAAWIERESLSEQISITGKLSLMNDAFSAERGGAGPNPTTDLSYLPFAPVHAEMSLNAEIFRTLTIDDIWLNQSPHVHNIDGSDTLHKLYRDGNAVVGMEIYNCTILPSPTSKLRFSFLAPNCPYCFLHVSVLIDSQTTGQRRRSLLMLTTDFSDPDHEHELTNNAVSAPSPSPSRQRVRRLLHSVDEVSHGSAVFRTLGKNAEREPTVEIEAQDLTSGSQTNSDPPFAMVIVIASVVLICSCACLCAGAVLIINKINRKNTRSPSDNARTEESPGATAAPACSTSHNGCEGNGNAINV